MTREEAIEILKQRECCRECVVDIGDCNDCDKAFEMAIKALENEPIDKSYELWKESYEVEAERNAKLQQQLDRASAPEYEYRMVRSFHPSSRNPGSALDEHLRAGYEFVRASEYIPPYGDKVGYIEYILRRKKEEAKNEI